uniref:TauD/TfdA-like domain-containing protein n=1 Tax=Ditylum brightwellii TaxID=49249 RepID=A0A7S2EIE1_9STRA|mmetsp:Transcript_30463/g.45347  ORF Transcript_30463/g.45347 Transcript_30463/m.45347 type:complete len:396 (+) Transcript_30463:112-1299(+)
MARYFICVHYAVSIAAANGLVATSQQAAQNNLLPCPKTLWKHHDPFDMKKYDVRTKRDIPFLKQIQKPVELTNEEAEFDWLQINDSNLMNILHQHGALHFTNFSLPKSKQGFRSFVEALPLQACEDSLQSIGVRSLLSKSNGVYQAVDSEKLSQTFIGLHNDCTYELAPPFAAFCCFEQAHKGGEFLLANGREILYNLDLDQIQKLFERSVRVRVAALPTPFLVNNIHENYFKKRLAWLIEKIVAWVLKTYIPELRLETAYSSNRTMLQILEPKKSTINCHPRTGEPTFFSGIHSQSAYLQQIRAADAFQGVAMTDVFYAEETDDDGIAVRPMEVIESGVLDHIESVMKKHTIEVLMQPGDVVLLDSYQVLHGRDTFQGPREHGVIWLTNSYFSL